MMASLDVLFICIILLCTGILSASQSTPTGTEKVIQTKDNSLKYDIEEEAAADDDDEIALEDYVDNELPNFSGDVSSAVFGDTTGYDVHIEVKIANRSKTKDNKNENNEASDSTPITTVSPKNRMKAKKILDLIIEKLKHKKDAKEKVDDTTDVEIEDDSEKSIKAKNKHVKSTHTAGTDETPNEEIVGKEEGSRDDIVDSIEKKTESKGSPLPLKDQDMVSSTKTKDQEMTPPTKTKNEDSTPKVKEQDISPPTKTKEQSVASHTKTKDKETNAVSKPKDQSKNQHTFNLPSTGKADVKEESFSFKNFNSQHMPKTSILTDSDESAAAPSKITKSTGKSEKWETSRNNKNIKIKVSGDEIRIKVPEFLNKTALFSRILSIIAEDGKKPDIPKIIKTKSDSFGLAKQSFLDVGSKLGNNTPPFYKFLLLKKIHKNIEKPNHLEQITDHHIPSDAVANLDDISSKKVATVAKENINEQDDVPTAKVNSIREKDSDTQEDITTKKKASNLDHQDAITEKKISSTSHKEDSSEQNTVSQGELLEEKEDISELRVKAPENKEDGSSDKEKSHEEKSISNDSEFNEKADGTKNENFVPNNFASKAFQENLEPEEMGNNKIVDNSNINKITDKKVLDIIPEELHIEDINSPEKDNIAPKKIDNKPSIGRNHKLESTNSNSIMGGMKHGEEHGPKLNPGRLFNDSLFQQAGIQSSDSTEEKQKIEKPRSSAVPVNNGGEITTHHSKTITDKKSEKISRPIIDVLTFPEFIHEKSTNILESKKEKVHSTGEEKHEKLHTIEESKHKSHASDDKHEKSHTIAGDKHEKAHSGGGEEKHEKFHEEDKHEKFHEEDKHEKFHEEEKHEKFHEEEKHEKFHDLEDKHEKIENIIEDKHDKLDTMLGDKEEKPEPITGEKFKPLNNPLPSILFKEILNTDDTVSKLSKKSKHSNNNKKPDKDKDILEDDERPLKKKEKLVQKDIDDEVDNETTIPEHKHKASSTIRTKNSAPEATKLDLSDLASLQLQSKDNLEIGNEEEEEGTGDDDEYEDASGDDDEIAEMKDNPDSSNLSIANLAIWKASEDIHALLHSLTDREHADRVLGNLRNFIRNKHSADAKKRNSFDFAVDLKKAKNYHLPAIKTKSTIKDIKTIPRYLEVKKKSSVPEKFIYENAIDLKKKSNIPRYIGKSKDTKRQSIRYPKPAPSTTDSGKRRVIEYDKYTNHTGQGLDRLYNQVATANARIPPTFADDMDGWSSDEIRNVMTQLKSADIDDDIPAGANEMNGALNSEFQDIGMQSYAGAPEHHIGLPQNNGHVAAVPLKELIGYQKEIRNQMLQSKLLNNKNGIFSKSPTIPEFRKNKVSQLNSASLSRGSSSSHGDYLSYNGLGDNPSGTQPKSQLTYPYNTSVQFGNGDYIEGTPDYNLNRDRLWWDRSYKRNVIP